MSALLQTYLSPVLDCDERPSPAFDLIVEAFPSALSLVACIPFVVAVLFIFAPPGFSLQKMALDRKMPFRSTLFSFLLQALAAGLGHSPKRNGKKEQVDSWGNTLTPEVNQHILIYRPWEILLKCSPWHRFWLLPRKATSMISQKTPELTHCPRFWRTGFHFRFNSFLNFRHWVVDLWMSVSPSYWYLVSN